MYAYARMAIQESAQDAETLALVKEFFARQIPFNNLLGMEVDTLAPGFARVRKESKFPQKIPEIFSIPPRILARFFAQIAI